MAELGVILGFWEAAAGPARGRASRLLAAAGEADPLGLTLGQAACRLIELRSRLIGDSLTCLATCPTCREVNEASFAASGLLSMAGDPVPVTVEASGWRATARSPTLDDLDAAALAPDLDAAADRLLARSVLAVERPAAAGPDEPLPDELVEAIQAELDAADPLADPRFAFACTACGEKWEVAFDPSSFLAEELGAEARRAMAEVASLALWLAGDGAGMVTGASYTMDGGWSAK